ncbi:MAG: PKD domain-containing protein [Candidatus Marinimicrobia bacterium]|nr:PKD domain-containing protein [Candidatus Neomarinimicrobiota bacterium]
MLTTKIIRSLFIALISIIVLTAAQNIVPDDNGYFYTDSMYSKIYYTDNTGTETILTGPGVGYYYTLSPDKKLLGFKYRENPAGKEAPAILNIADGEITILHEPVFCAGQVSFSNNNDLAYTIDNTLFVKTKNMTSVYDLGNYANLTPISPDGEYLVYNDDNDQLWILRLEDNVRERITDSQYGNVFPSWSADSRFIAFNSLNGVLKIYDRVGRSTLELGHGANLRWSDNSNEFTYTKFILNEEREISNTDIIVSNMQDQVIFSTKTAKVKENNSFYGKDGKVLYFNELGSLEIMEDNSLHKKNTGNIAFPTAPVSFGQEVPSEDTYLDVPYIHQVYDTPGPRGYSSCAPTTAAMVLAYYELLPKWPYISGFGNLNNYGAYVHERYYYNDNYFDLTYTDCNTAQTTCYTTYGGMGYMWTGGSPNSRMLGYYNKHGVSGNQTWNTTWSTVTTEIDKEQPFSICNFLSSSGHLVVGLGRASNDQRTVIVNDPYGNRNESTWPNYNGAVVRYDWPGYNHGHASLNYANSSYTSMPWCIATSYTAPALIDSIVDDKQFNNGFYIKAEGNIVPMRYYHSTKSGYGGHHWWTYSEASAEDICYVVWTPQMAENAYYKVSAYIPANASATTAIYRVYHAAGVSNVIIDQSAHPDTWVSLGKYLMKTDGTNYIYLGDSTGVSSEKITFDAIKWEPASQEELDFTSDYTNGYPDYDVNFWPLSDLASGTYSYSWDFGDGSYGIGDTISHAYADTGTYTVTLTAEANGVSLSITHLDLIHISSNLFSGTEIKLVYPDSMSIINTRRPVLTWEVVDDGSALILGETPEFDSTSTFVWPVNNYYQVNEELKENKTYYWVVSGINGRVSRTWAFKVNSINSLPETFDLAFPEDNAVLDTLRPYFEWQASRDIDPGDQLDYNLYIGTDIDSMECVYSGIETNFQVTADFKENGRYLWYVDAIDPAMASRRSSEEFRHLGINTVNEAPPAPKQISPTHNSYQTTRYPHLEWTSVQDPDPGDQVHYKVFYWYEGSSVYVINSTETFHDQRRFRDQTEYYWTVAAIDESDVFNYSDTLTVYIDTELDIVDIPKEFSLQKNYPNPFNPVTQIMYTLPQEEFVEINVYDLSGKHVTTLTHEFHQAGNYLLQFNASGLASGIYIYTMKAGEFQQSAKMLLLK